jgi:flavin reductase (DIM6/NTAB) family NADH-FMN oxidoreductase RutF
MSTDDASKALSSIQYTAIVVGTKSPKGNHFMLANWGTQASFDPWRYVVMLKKESHTLANARRNEAFTVNLVTPDQEETIRAVMKKKGEGMPGSDGPTGAPRLADAFAGFDCKVVETHDIGGDHILVVSEVVDGWCNEESPALTLGKMNLAYAG